MKMTTLRPLALVLLCFFTASIHAAMPFPVSTPETGPRLLEKGEVRTASIAGGHVVVWNERSFTEDWMAGAIVNDDGSLMATLPGVRTSQRVPGHPGTIAAANGRVLIAGGCGRSFNDPTVCISWINVDTRTIGQPIALAENAFSASAAWNGETYLVAYVEAASNDRSLIVREISPGGEIGPPIEVLPYAWGTTPALAAVGDTFYIAAEGDNQAVLAAVRDGRVIRTLDLEHPSNGIQIGLTSEGDELIVATNYGLMRRYRDAEPVSDWTWFAARGVDRPRAIRIGDEWAVVAARFSGAYFGDDLHLFRIGHDERAIAGRVRHFDAVALDNGFLLVWSADNHIVANRFSTAGAPMSVPEIASIGAASQASPAAAFGAGDWLVAWTELNRDYWQVRVRRFSLDGDPLGPARVLSASAVDQILPSVAFNGESFLVVWTEGSVGRNRVRAIGLSSSGDMIHPAPIEIAGPVPERRWDSGVLRAADVSWAGTSWMIVAEGETGIEIRRLAPNGVLLDPFPLVLQRGNPVFEIFPVVDCSSDGECLIAWHTLIDPPPCNMLCPPDRPDTVAVARVTNELKLLDEQPKLLSGLQDAPTGDVRTLSVSWNDAQDAWLVVWGGPQARRVSRSGEVLDPPVAAFSWPSFSVSSAAEGGGWRLVWTSRRVSVFMVDGVLTGWTDEGVTGPHARSQLLIGPYSTDFPEINVASGPRTLIAFVTTPDESGGAHRVYLRFVDHSQPSVRRRSVRRAPQ